mmetsp:Transcript_84192/g.186857  ORF Transcript_84192/g.186857 Transcript_84192/m.186857 type:complete len:319 (-) Transcript_84192:59-1015(-)
MPRMKSMSIFEFWVRLICAVLLMVRSSCCTSSKYSGVTKSVLLSMMRSAKATCSTASLTAPFGFSSRRCCMICLASTTVRIPSRAMLACTKSSAKKVCATGAGSARPVVSMMMPSSGFPLPEVCLWSFFKPAMRSPRTVQQMHPLFISITFSSVALRFVLSKASSMPTSPNSFSMIAIRLPCSSSRMWLSSVVLPAPRKPVMMVVGVLSLTPFASTGCPDFASNSFLRSANAPSPGRRRSAAPRSTKARFWAPRLVRSSARKAKSSARSFCCASSRRGNTFCKKASGARKMSCLSIGGKAATPDVKRSSYASKAEFTI